MNEFAYRFGEFHLIPARRELWCSGRLVRIQPKVLETLTYLVQHRDRAVGSDELIAAVWGRVDVSDNVLGQIVGRARRVVGDSGETQHSIRTVPRFGYRWIREVELASVEADHAEENAQAPADGAITHRSTPSGRIRPWDRWSIAVSTLALFCVVGLAGWTFTQRLAADDPKATTKVLAANPSAWSAAERMKNLRDALASNHLDLARAIFRTLSDQERIRPEVRHQAAELALKEGRFDEALSAFTALLTDLGDHGSALLVGPSLYGAGLAEFRRNHLEPAKQYYERAISVLAKAGPDARVTLGLAWSSLGRLHSTREAFDEADHAYAQARVALEGAGDLAALALLESNVGVTMIGRYRYAEALPRFQRAADLAAQTNDVNAEVRARMNLVNVQLVLLQPAAALESETRLRDLRERTGDPVLAALVDLVRVKALTANGRLGEAQLVLRAHASRPTPDDAMLAAVRDLASADLAFAQGALDEGSRYVRSLLTLPWDSFGDDGVAAYARWRLLEASKAQGNAQGVAEAVSAVDALSRLRPNEPTVSLYASLARAEAADAKSDTSRARSEFGRALVQAETTQVPFDLVRVVASYTQFLLSQGEVAQAGVVASRIADWVDRDYGASLVQLEVDHAIGGEAWTTALARTRRLAGERVIPTALSQPPSASPSARLLDGRELASVRLP